MKKNNEFHLLPAAWRGQAAPSFQTAYIRAFSRATELFVVSAFLTEWPRDLKLNAQCKTFMLIVGADFGTTRRAALEAALDWLPERFAGNVLAFNQKGVSFHPKAVLWREHDGSCHFLIGSSNLTRAAFESNVEANVTLHLSKDDYDQALEWLREIMERSVEVNDRWLEKYKEALIRGGSQDSGQTNDEEQAEEPVFDLALELDNAEERQMFERVLEGRRAQRLTFDARSKKPLLALLRATIAKSNWTPADNSNFYDGLRHLWSRHSGTQMGGSQWTIKGRHADHQELAKSLAAVIDARPMERDAVVSRERDRLRIEEITTRSAVMTELLCHLFPKQYPILDGPVRRWGSAIGLDDGGTEGERYIRLARAMRAALRGTGPQRLGIVDLAELDTLIWFQEKKHEL